MTTLRLPRFGSLRARVSGLWRSDASESTAIPVRDWINVSSGAPARLLAFDQALLCIVLALLALGLVMVYSASIAMPCQVAEYEMARFIIAM